MLSYYNYRSLIMSQKYVRWFTLLITMGLATESSIRTAQGKGDLTETEANALIVLLGV